MSTVYWKFNENFFISLTGNVLNFTKEEEIEISLGVLEENSAKNLMKLFTCESISSATSSPNDPLSNLVESLVRLGQVSIEKGREVNEEDRNPNNYNRSDGYNCNSSSRHNTIHEIYFQSSVVIGGKKEYPLYIIKNGKIELEELSIELKNLKNFEEKSNLLQEFYLKKDPENSSIELEIFKGKNGVYEALFEPIENVEKMMKSLKADGLKLSDLDEFNDQEIDFDLKILEMIFNEMISTKIPSEKLSKLLKFHSSLTRKQEATADSLLPLLTYALICLENGHEIAGQVKFIERFVHPINLNGLNNYILTSTVLNLSYFYFYYYFNYFSYFNFFFYIISTIFSLERFN